MIPVIKAVGVCQYVVTLHFRFGLLELADFRLSCAQSRNISFHRRVVHFDDRSVGTSVIGCIIHGECRPESEMFQEIHFTEDISRCTVVLGFGSIGFQSDVYHRVVNLCFLKLG